MTTTGLQHNKKYKVLFVCAGNICRSPLAEVVFIEQARSLGVLDQLHVESRGTGNWHEGDGADERSVHVARLNKLDLCSHRAKQVRSTDFEEYDRIIAMDRLNVRDLQRLSKKRVELFRDYDPEDTEKDVPDPYTGGPEGFKEVYDIVSRCSAQLLETLLEEQVIRR